VIALHNPVSHPLVVDGTRREFLALLAASGLLAGCGGEEAADEAGGGSTRPFEHAMGTTEVPVSPSRIVSLHSTSITWQLATLGVVPIATSSAPADDPTVYIRLADPAAAAALDGIVSVGDAELDLEQIASLRPDLIVGDDYNAEQYDELSAIAPTVLVRSDEPDDRYLGVQRRLAELTGTMDVLERLHDEYDARTAALRERYGDRWADLRWVVLDEVDPSGSPFLTNLTAAGPAHRVLTDLGAPLAESARRLGGRDAFAEITRELLPDLDADVLFVAPPWSLLAEDPDTPVSADIAELLRSTPAGLAGQVRRVGLAWTNSNVSSFGAILDDIEAALAERSGEFFDTGSRR
jgi:iron complex transport system substrate-binding protein